MGEFAWGQLSLRNKGSQSCENARQIDQFREISPIRESLVIMRGECRLLKLLKECKLEPNLDP